MRGWRGGEGWRGAKRAGGCARVHPHCRNRCRSAPGVARASHLLAQGGRPQLSACEPQRARAAGRCGHAARSPLTSAPPPPPPMPPLYQEALRQHEATSERLQRVAGGCGGVAAHRLTAAAHSTHPRRRPFCAPPPPQPSTMPPISGSTRSCGSFSCWPGGGGRPAGRGRRRRQPGARAGRGVGGAELAVLFWGARTQLPPPSPSPYSSLLSSSAKLAAS